MSKNIYRVNKKTDLDEIMKNNMYKPICICFLSKSKNQDIYDDLSSTILTISKINTYSMNIIIDFDNFTDDFNGNVGYFDSIKNNTPYFMAFFKGKIIATCDNSENFIPIVANHLEQIHSTYLDKLTSIFDNPNPVQQVQQVHQTQQVQTKNLEQTNTNPSINNNSNNQQQNVNNTSNNQKIDDNISNEIPNELEDEVNDEVNDKVNDEVNDEVNDKTSDNESEEKNIKVKNKTKKKLNKSKKTSKKIFEKDIEDNQSIQSYKSNDTIEIEKQKEKLKKLKQLKELQNMLNQ